MAQLLLRLRPAGLALRALLSEEGGAPCRGTSVCSGCCHAAACRADPDRRGARRHCCCVAGACCLPWRFRVLPVGRRGPMVSGSARCPLYFFCALAGSCTAIAALRALLAEEGAER